MESDNFIAGLKSISMKIGGFFGGVEMRNVYFEGDTAVINKVFFDGNSFSAEAIESVSSQYFLDQIRDVHIENWRCKYYDNTILDGEQWEIVLEYEEKKNSYYGSNEYPENFDDFLKVMGIDSHD